MYGVLALAPGTVLGMYLYTVKQKMTRENEKLRLEHVESELQEEQQHLQHDLLLEQKIEDLRSRIQQLEQEKQGIAPALTSASNTSTPAEPANPYPVKSNDESEETSTSAIVPSFVAGLHDTVSSWKTQFDEVKQQLQNILDDPEIDTNSPPRQPRRTTSQQGAASGISERIRRQEQEMIAQDVKAYKATQSNASQESK